MLNCKATVNWNVNSKNKNQPRRWYQLHARAKMLMLCACGVMLITNVRGRKSDTFESAPIPPHPGLVMSYISKPTLRGWPIVFQKSFNDEYVSWNPPGIGEDGAVALAIVALVTAAGEWILRKRDAREKPKTE